MSSKKAALFKGATSNINTGRTGLLAEADRVKGNITILPELEAYIPPLSEDEFEYLERDIIENGCREALLVWTTYESVVYENDNTNPINILVDGHNRYRICKKNNLDFSISVKEFTSMQEAKFWMIRNQIGRRNLTPENYAFLRGKLYNSLKEERGRYDREDKEPEHFQISSSENVQNVSMLDKTHSVSDVRVESEPPIKKKTAQVLAEKFNVTEKTIRNDGQFAQGIDKLSPELQKDVLSRKAKVPKADIIKLAATESEAPIQSVDEIRSVLKRNAINESTQEKSSGLKPGKLSMLLPANQPKTDVVGEDQVDNRSVSDSRLESAAKRQAKIINEIALRLQLPDTFTRETCEELLVVIDEMKNNVSSLMKMLK